MICPECQSTNINKNGLKRGKQNHICKDCGRQFIEVYSPQGYRDEVKRYCLHLYVEGNGFRRIERLTGVCHNTVINWVKASVESLPQYPDYQEIPEVSQIDELHTYVGKKKQSMGVDCCQ
jgi:insertion element IS1 protein InsB